MKLSYNDRLKWYAFDVDSNLLFTDTKILLEKFDWKWRCLVEVSQSEYPELIKLPEYRFWGWNREKSMQNFLSIGTFKNEIIDALDNNKFWPSRPKLLQATVTARPISIITARGHPIDEIRDAHQFIIFEILNESEIEQLVNWMKINKNIGSNNKNKIIKMYLDNNLYLPIRSKDFEKISGINLSLSTRERKLVWFEMFIEHLYKVFESYMSKSYLKDKKISVGFSDDYEENIVWMRDFMENVLLKKYPKLKFSVYDTANPNFVKKISLERDN